MAMEPKPLSQEEFLAWKADPVTQVTYQLMRLWKEKLKEQWSKKVFQRDDPQSTAEANAAALAQIEVLDKLLEIDEVNIQEAFEDE